MKEVLQVWFTAVGLLAHIALFNYFWARYFGLIKDEITYEIRFTSRKDDQ